MNTTIDGEALTGHSLVGTAAPGNKVHEAQPKAQTFRVTDPLNGEAFGPDFHVATDADVARAAHLASRAFESYENLSGETRAEFLIRIGDGLEQHQDALVARAMRETALAAERLRGETSRTANQLRMFANLIRDEAWRNLRIDRGDPNRKPAPKPDIRSMRRALGPVAVFGASNFPLAFSVAGGDTAAALAAGCPVVVKAHPSHPGTSELVGTIIAKAARDLELPEGVFSLLFDEGYEVGIKLVEAPEICAVGFTGSRSGGEALVRAAAARPKPIPVYAEMGSVNPVFVLPDAARARGKELAEGLHSSFTQGVGQFCTNPGVVLVPYGDAGDKLVNDLKRLTEKTTPGTMLSSRVCQMYNRGLDALREAGARALARGTQAEGATVVAAAIWEVSLEDTLINATLLNEVFGPSTLIVRYKDSASLVDFARTLEGQLTATIHAQPDEIPAVSSLAAVLADRAGRVLFGGFPTGVEVSPAMVHGGPFPATSDGRGTSVGTGAIERYTRLVAYQDFPQELLPVPLRNIRAQGL